ncbi:MAG: hypothetical protein WCX74_04175, partial [Candidatus Paceibacterota bacterium]
TPTNNPPVVIITGTTVVNSGDLIYASVTASDPDGDTLYYFWERSEGAITIDPSGLNVTVTSPNHICSVQHMTVSVRVSDNKGGEVIKTLNVQVNPIGDGMCSSTDSSANQSSSNTGKNANNIEISNTLVSGRQLPQIKTPIHSIVGGSPIMAPA